MVAERSREERKTVTRRPIDCHNFMAHHSFISVSNGWPSYSEQRRRRQCEAPLSGNDTPTHTQTQTHADVRFYHFCWPLTTALPACSVADCFFPSPLFVFLLIFASISLLFLGNLSRYCYIPVHHARTSFSTPAKTNKLPNKSR